MTISMKKRISMFRINYRWLVVLVLVMLGLCGCRPNNPDENEIQTGEVLVEKFPVLYIADEGYSYNYLQPYEIKMDVKSMYGSLVPAQNEEPITFVSKGNTEEIIRVEYTLYDMLGKLIENGTVSTDAIKADGSFDISLNNLTSDEAQLELKLCFSETKDAYYYTRVISGNDVTKAIGFVQDIENACLKKESPVDLTLSMEWDLVTSRASYYETDINASYEQVTWAGLNIVDVSSDYYISVVDSSEGITSFRVNYSIYAGNETETTYQVTDFLRVREVNNEMFLLNFYRNTSEDFSRSENVFDTDTIYMGVGSGAEEYVSIDSDKHLFFVQNQCLYHFDVEANRISTVYAADSTLRQQNVPLGNKCNIQPLGKRNGYFYFIVSGYLSDESHSGANGISIIRYNMDANVYEEVFFQPVRYNHEILMDELDMLSYMNEEGSVFFISNGEIRSYNVDTNTLKDEIKNISLDSLIVSPGDGYIGWSKKQDGGEDILAVRNLNTGDELTISPKEGTRIIPIGFVKNDLVYGVSDIKETDSTVATDKQQLIYNICIVDENGELIKEYPQEGKTRVLSGETSDTVIVLNQGEPAAAGNVYSYTTQQQIVSGGKTKNSTITKKEIKDSNKGNVWAFCFENAFKGSPTFSIATLQDAEGVDKLSVEPAEISTYYKDKYFLYAKGELYGIYKVMREALNEAAEMAGVVTDFENNKLYYRIAKSKTAEVLPQKADLAEQLLKSEDGVVKAWSEKVTEVNVLDITGFSPDNMLLFISKGFPVLARYDAETFIWVIGYTENTLKCQRSDSDEMFEITMEKAEEIFAKTGYEYYTCND